MSQLNCKLINWLTPTLQIHCWGGLGSQLFAWAVVEQCLLEKPNRRISLVLHTSGVTQRSSELSALAKIVTVLQIADFKPGEFSPESTPKVKIRGLFRRWVLLMLRKSKFILSTEKIEDIKPWTFQLRSHYSRRYIPTKVCESMFNRLVQMELLENSFSEIEDLVGVHYRLGDLLTLENKSYVPHEKIISVIQDLSSQYELNRSLIKIHSDSPEVAIQKLSPLRENFTIQLVEQKPWETLSALLQYKYLVVTNSKIGIWAIIFKVRLGLPHLIIAPKEMKSDLTLILGRDIYTSKIEFY
jgi:hypothetical protein